jgi:molecular chaperone GrpE
MTEDTEATAAEEQQPAEDPFEVKWRKKTERPSPAPTVEAETADAASLKQELEAERQRTKDLQERWQRAAADLANLRRRTEQDRGEVEKFATMLLVQELLPVLDNFERALSTIPGNLAMLTWIQGVALIERHLEAILQQQGLAAIEAQGQPFNPHLHEAIAEVETADAAPGTVVREYQKGYTMHGRVIRPTLVEIAREPAPVEPEASVEASEPEAEVTGAEPAEHIAEEAGSNNVGP